MRGGTTTWAGLLDTWVFLLLITLACLCCMPPHCYTPALQDFSLAGPQREERRWGEEHPLKL